MATFVLDRGGLILFNAGSEVARTSWKWNYRKRRSIHDRAWPRETLITATYAAIYARGAVGRGVPPVCAAKLSSKWGVSLIFNEVRDGGATEKKRD